MVVPSLIHKSNYKCSTSIIALPLVKQGSRRCNQTALQLEAPNIHTISIITHDSHHSTHSRSKYLSFPIAIAIFHLHHSLFLSQPPTYLIPPFRYFISPPSPLQIRPFCFYFAIAVAPCQLGHLHSPPCHKIHSG